MKALAMATILSTCAALAAEPEAREWQAPNGTTVRHRFHAPEKTEAGKTYPLILFLHGAGERGSDNTAQLKHGVPAILAGADALGQPCFLIAPQCPAGQWWSPAVPSRTRLSAAAKPNALLEAVIALVDETAKSQPVDPTRIYLTGISMGGFATWDLLGRAPGKWAAAVPICGGGDPELAATFGPVPIHAFHGEADSVVPVRATRDMITALETSGRKPLATYYPGVGHNSWTQTYANPELIRWIFTQRKTD